MESVALRTALARPTADLLVWRKGGVVRERQQSAGSRRVGVVAIVVQDRQMAARRVNELLSEYGDIIVGRMGIPYRDRGVSVIALIVDGDTDVLVP
jgi:putative iron-only hydrogenase system regulator